MTLSNKVAAGDITQATYENNAEAIRVLPVSFADETAKITKIDPDASAPVYIGTNYNPTASDSAVDWSISKITYSSGEITQIQVKVGAWQDRVSLF